MAGRPPPGLAARVSGAGPPPLAPPPPNNYAPPRQHRPHQAPADKAGVSNLVADLLDEGSGDLDSKTFHERLERRAIELSFNTTRDYFRGSLRMLRDNKDEAFDLLRKSLTSAHFDSADVERIRSQIVSGLRRDTSNPTSLATPNFLQIPYGHHPSAPHSTPT